MAALTMVASLLQPSSPVHAELTSPCYTPVLRDVMISQGLPSYPVLARGKSTLAKFFFSLPNDPTCSVSTHQVTFIGGTLTMTYNTGYTATQQVALPESTLTPLAAYTSAAQAAGSGDPTFVLPGNKLTPSNLDSTAASAPYPVRFSTTMRYRARNPVTGESAERTLPAITTDEAGVPLERSVDRPTNPLRVLVVPMGDGRKPYSDVLPLATEGSLHQAMTTVSRLLPVADGIGDLLSDTGGLRYSIAPSQRLINLGPHDEDGSPATLEKNYIDAQGLYCASPAHFTYIQAKLAEARTAWNSANPSRPAHRVLGVIGHAVSRGASTDVTTDTRNDSGCIEGYAGIGAPEAWSRLVLADGDDKVQSAGGLAAMELLHTLGNVPQTRSSGSYHSPNVEADATAAERGYNTAKKTYLPSDRSVMRFAFSGWTDDNVLAESADYQQAGCVLTSGSGDSLSSSTCVGAGSVGAVAAAAVDALFLAGVTDGTAAGTRAHTYVAPHRGDERPPATSDYQVVYHRSVGDPVRTNLAVTFTHSKHEGHEHDTAVTGTTGVFDASYDAPPDTTRFDIVKRTATGDVVLYSRSKNVRPQTTTVRPPRGAGDAVPVAAAAGVDESNPTVSTDGQLIAHVVDGDVVLRQVSAPGQVLATISDAAEPALAHDSSALAFTRSGSIYLASIGRNPFGAFAVGTPRVVYQYRDGAAGGPDFGRSPAFSPDGGAIAFSMADHVWTASTSTDADNYCATASDGSGTAAPLPPTQCRQVTSDNPDVIRQYGPELDWSPATGTYPNGLLAVSVADYTDNEIGQRDLHVLDMDQNPAQHIGSVEVAEQPDFGGGRLFFYDRTPQSNGMETGPSSVSTAGLGDRRPVAGLLTSADRLSVAADDVTSVFQRPEVVDGEVFAFDVYLVRAEAAPRQVVISDDKPEDLRLDVFARCGSGTALYPVLTGLYPDNGGPSGPKTFTVDVDETALCPDALLVYRGTDGFQFTEPAQDEEAVTGRLRPVATTVYPRQSDTFSMADSIPLQVSGWDSSSRPLTTEFTVAGPGGTRTGELAPGGRTDLAPFKVPGLYTVTARVVEASGAVGESSSTFVLYRDADGDRIPFDRDVDCSGVGADHDPANAVSDPDGDVRVGEDDPRPCTSDFNAVIDVDANRIQPLSQGTQVTVYVSGPLDLAQYTASQITISRFGGEAVRIPAARWSSDGLRWSAKFDRQTIQRLAKSRNLTGYVPITVSGERPGARFDGADPRDPTFG